MTAWPQTAAAAGERLSLTLVTPTAYNPVQFALLKWEESMKDAKIDMLTAGNIAKELGVPDAKVKKAIADLKLAPDAKKGPCCYYSRASVTKIKGALK